MSIILQFSGFFVDWLRKNEILTTTQVRIYMPYVPVVYNLKILQNNFHR